MNEELKPCQCGSDVELCRGDDDYYIYCPKCKLKTFSDRVYDNITDNCDRLVEVWNERADDYMRLKEFRTDDYSTVLIDIDSISSVYETRINGRCAAVVVMQQGESYTLDMSISELKRKLNID